MHRVWLWSFAYSPMIIGVLLMVYVSDSIGESVMYLSIFTVPYCILKEQKILEEKGVNFENGSPVGNFLAKLLGAIFICCTIALFGKMGLDIVELNQ